MPRLLVRPDPNNWFASEYAYRLDGRVTLMTSKFGDCLFRSSLRVLEVKNSAAHNALRARLASTAVRGTSLGDGIKGVYDARITGAAVSEMLDATAIVTAGNVEEEYPGAYISNAIDQAYKVWPTDSQTVKLIKALAKDILMSYFGQYQYLWTWIKNFFGFE